MEHADFWVVVGTVAPLLLVTQFAVMAVSYRRSATLNPRSADSWGYMIGTLGFGATLGSTFAALWVLSGHGEAASVRDFSIAGIIGGMFVLLLSAALMGQAERLEREDDQRRGDH